jgi:hypothetical protein
LQFFSRIFGLFKRNAYVAVEKLTFACPSTSNKGIDEQTIIFITVAWSCSSWSPAGLVSRGCMEAPSASSPQTGLRSFQKRQLDSLTKYKMVRKLTAAVLGIRDILVRIPLLSSLILRMENKNFTVFSCNLPTGTSSSV